VNGFSRAEEDKTVLASAAAKTGAQAHFLYLRLRHRWKPCPGTNLFFLHSYGTFRLAHPTRKGRAGSCSDTNRF